MPPQNRPYSLTRDRASLSMAVHSAVAVNEMLQTAKLFARRGSSLEPNVSGSGKRVNGLTFGEFCVLAADLKRFRTTAQQHNHQPPHQSYSTHTHQRTTNNAGGSNCRSNTVDAAEPAASTSAGAAASGCCWPQTHGTTTAAADAAEHGQPLSNGSEQGALSPAAPEVFLGGSCNPTTWRADVAIPALDKLGISFYNPVSACVVFVCHPNMRLCVFCICLHLFAASVRLDARPHRAGASRQREGARPILRHGLGDARVRGRHRGGTHCRPERPPPGAGVASVPAEAVHLERTDFRTVSVQGHEA